MRIVACSFFVFVLGACGGAVDSDLFGNPIAVDAGADTKMGIDASTTTATDAASPKDVSVVAVDAADATSEKVGIQCGQIGSTITACDPITELCCRSQSLNGDTFSCVTDPNDCQNFGDVPLNCAKPADCIAEGGNTPVCCVETQNALAVDSTCIAAKANCKGSIACNPAGPPAQCPTGTSCKISKTTLPGYYLCL